MTNIMDSPAKPKGNRTSRLAADGAPRLTKSDIARLSLGGIRQMNSEELIELILVAEVPLLREYVSDHVWYSGRENLELLAFLAWRTVRNQGY